MNTKVCNTCQKEKPISDFGLSRNPDNENGHNYRNPHRSYKSDCKPCSASYAREWRKKNKNYRGSGKLSQYTQEDRKILSCISSKVIGCKSNTRKRNKDIPFEIDRDYVFELYKQQKGLCALSGMELSIEIGSLRGLSIDKINPDKGYVKGNIQLLCWAVNRAKGEINQDEFIQMCRLIIEKCND